MLIKQIKKIFSFLHKCIVWFLLFIIYFIFLGATKLFLILINSKLLKNSNAKKNTNWQDIKHFGTTSEEFNLQS